MVVKKYYWFTGVFESDLPIHGDVRKQPKMMQHFKKENCKQALVSFNLLCNDIIKKFGLVNGSVKVLIGKHDIPKECKPVNIKWGK